MLHVFVKLSLAFIARCLLADRSRFICEDIQVALRQVATTGLEFYIEATPTGARRVGDPDEFRIRAQEAIVNASVILSEIEQQEGGFQECVPDKEPGRTAAQISHALFKLLQAPRPETRKRLHSAHPFGTDVATLFDVGVSWRKLVHSGWPVFRLAALVEDETRQPMHVPLVTLQYNAEDASEECTPEQEYFHQISVLYAGEGRTVRMVDVEEFMKLWLQRDGDQMTTNGARFLLDLLFAHPLDDLRCRSSLAVAYVALADSLQCHWHRPHSHQSHELANAFLDIAQRHATFVAKGPKDEASPRSMKAFFTSRWPLLTLLARLEPPPPEARPAKDSPRIVVVSWSSREAELGGLNWAERFVTEVFSDVPGVEFRADVECADVYIFRSKLPINFGGVLIFVDGESMPEDSEYQEVLSRYPASILLGPMPAGGFAQNFRIPYASTSFASRKDFTPAALIGPRTSASAVRPRHFAAYLAYKCWPHREKFFWLLDAAAQERDLGRVHVLSRCGNTSTSEAQRRDKRYSATYIDDAARLFSHFRFALVFENRLSPRYVTEKIVNSFLGGAVPIYWGSPFVFRLFNPRAFIYVNSFPSFEAAVEYVVEVALDPQKYASYVEAPILQNTTDAPYYFSWHRSAPPMRNGMRTLREDLVAAALQQHRKGDSGVMPAIERRPWDYADVFTNHL